MEGYGLSLVCAFKKAIKNIQVKVDVQRGGLRFRIKIDKRYASFTQITFFIQLIWV